MSVQQPPSARPATPEAETDGAWEPGLSRIASWSGYVLAVSYPILALSTGARAGYQLFLKEDVSTYVGPWTSAIAASAPRTYAGSTCVSTAIEMSRWRVCSW